MTWDTAILSALSSEPKPLREIYREVAESPIVSAYHSEPWQPGLQPRFQCWIRSRLAQLKQLGLVKQTGRARYRLA